jgi:tetratricopeptide (TPR) repeat protein
LGAARAAMAQGDIAAIWNDPTFQKQFVGGYGINAEVEPPIAKAELAILEIVRPMMAEDLAKAESTLRAAIGDDSSAMLWFTLGGIQFQQERLPEALESHRLAVTRFPSFRRAWRNLGFINARLGNHDDTIKSFTRFVELGGADAYAFGFLGYSHMAKGDHQPAEAAFRNALLLQPTNTQWRQGLVQCTIKQKKFEDAVALLDVLIANNPEKAELWLLQAHAYLGLQQSLRAAENFEVLDRMAKSTVDTSFTLGDIYVNERLPTLAVAAYSKAVSMDIRQPVARPMRAAEGLAARGMLDEAKKVTAAMRRYMLKDMDPADQRKLLKLEARFAMANGSGSAEMVKLLEEIVQLDPLDGEALLLLARHWQHQGDPERAIFWYERAGGVAASEAEAKVRHGQILVSSGRYADALPLLRRAQQVKPREDVARYIEQVERLARSRT